MGQALLWITFLAVLVCVYAEAVQKRDVDTRHVENAPPQKKKDVPTKDVENSPQQKNEEDPTEDTDDEDAIENGKYHAEHPDDEADREGEEDELEVEQEDEDGHPVEEEHDKEITLYERSDEDARAFPWIRLGSRRRTYRRRFFLVFGRRRSFRRRSFRRRFLFGDNKHKNKVMNDE